MTDDPGADRVSQLIAAGDLAAAYDAAMRAIAEGNTHARLRYFAALALARMGATEQACTAYETLGIADIGDVDALSLHARLLKDAALDASPDGAADGLIAAAQAYRDVWDRTGDPFPGSNAATLYRLAGGAEQARDLARAMSVHPSIVAPQSYYDHVTRAEILLVQEDVAGARSALAAANPLAKSDRGARATTRRQLTRLAAAIGLDAEQTDDLLAPLAGGTVIHFCGRMFQADGDVESRVAAAVDEELDRLNPVAGYGALACGADILIAENLLKRGAELHVVLASSPQAFAATSVTPGGAEWLGRYSACLDAASSLRVVGDDSFADDPSSFALTTEIAIGRAIIRAQHLSLPACQISVDDRPESDGDSQAGTNADIARWKQTGHESVRINPPPFAPPVFESKTDHAENRPGRRALSLLFADFAGFTGLSEKDLPGFWEKVLGAAARALGEEDGNVVYRNTWGDACFAAFDDPAAAARAALSLQQGIARAWQTPEGSGMRISLHYGLAFAGPDPVLARESIYGHEVSRAARIEPITPPGAIYASENFAAACAARPGSEFRFGYVGRLELPKKFGTERLYRVTAGRG